MTDPIVPVLSSTELRSRASELGGEISRDYQGREPILVGVLQGAVVFLADLVRSLTIPVDVDFLALSRFGEGGRVRIAMDTFDSLEGRDVILVEDIVDTGLTLNVLRRLLETRDVASLATVTLLDKASRRLVETPLEYRGFEVGDEFLLGYGLDWEGHYRNLPSMWAVLDLGAFAADPEMLARRAFETPGDRLKP